MGVIKAFKEVLLAKKFSHIDREIGLLRRVSGYWRVESPKRSLGVNIKIFGSDRFGPNKKALNAYKYIYRNKFELIWEDAIKAIMQQLSNEKLSWYSPEIEFTPLEIIFGEPGLGSVDMAIAFSISSIENNEFYANFFNGQYKEFGGMYCYHK